MFLTAQTNLSFKFPIPLPFFHIQPFSVYSLSSSPFSFTLIPLFSFLYIFILHLSLLFILLLPPYPPLSLPFHFSAASSHSLIQRSPFPPSFLNHLHPLLSQVFASVPGSSLAGSSLPSVITLSLSLSLCLSSPSVSSLLSHVSLSLLTLSFSLIIYLFIYPSISLFIYSHLSISKKNVIPYSCGIQTDIGRNNIVSYTGIDVYPRRSKFREEHMSHCGVKSPTVIYAST